MIRNPEIHRPKQSAPLKSQKIVRLPLAPVPLPLPPDLMDLKDPSSQRQQRQQHQPEGMDVKPVVGINLDEERINVKQAVMIKKEAGEDSDVKPDFAIVDTFTLS